MKFLPFFFVTFFFFRTFFAQINFEHTGSIYDFWSPTQYRVLGDYAYVGTGNYDEINIYNISNPNSITLAGKWKTGYKFMSSLNIYEGYLYINSRIYFGTGTWDYTPVLLIYDLTNPIEPFLVTEMANGPEWRERKTDYSLFVDQYFYDGNFEIWDFTDPTNPVLAFDQSPYFDEEGKIYQGKFGDVIYFTSWYYFMGSRIDVTTRLLDVSDPTLPVVLGEYNHDLNLHDNTLQEDTLDYNAGSFNGSYPSILKIRSFADPFNPVELGSTTCDVEGAEYSKILGKKDNYVFVKDVLNDISRFISVDVSDPYNPFIANTHNLEVMKSGANIEFENNSFSWVNDSTNLVMVDVTDPLNPVETSSPKLSDDPTAGPLMVLQISGDKAFLAKTNTQSSIETTIYIVDISNNKNPIELGRFILPGSVIRMKAAANGDYFYAAYEDINQSSINRKRLVIYDVSDPANAELKSNIRLADDVIDQLKFHEGYLYVVNYYSDVYDVSNPANPVIAYSYPDNHTDKLHNICFNGNLMYDSYTGTSTLILRDVSNPINPVTLGSTNLAYTNSIDDNIKYNNNKLFFLQKEKIEIYDVANFPNVNLAGEYNFTVSAGAVSCTMDYDIDDNYAYIATNVDGTLLLDIIDPANIVLAEKILVPGYSNNSIEVIDSYVYTANDRSFDIYELQLPLPPEEFSLISPSGTIATTTTELNWERTTDPNDSKPNYDVWLSTTENFADEELVAENISGTTFQLTDLLVGQTYWWKVRATDDNTSGTWSTNTLSFNVFTPEVTIKFENEIGGDTKGGVTVLDKNTIYVPSTSSVVRMDSSGNTQYTLNVNGTIKSSSTITSDHTVYIASTDNNLYSFNSNGVTNPN